MTNLDHKIENDGYLYEATPLTDTPQGMYHGALACYTHFVKAFEDAQASWEQKIKDEGLLYSDSFYLYSMTLAVEGVPSSLIANVDDVVQVFNIRQKGRIGVDEK